jgi:hypothetical protein
VVGVAVEDAPHSARLEPISATHKPRRQAASPVELQAAGRLLLLERQRRRGQRVQAVRRALASLVKSAIALANSGLIVHGFLEATLPPAHVTVR